MKSILTLALAGMLAGMSWDLLLHGKIHIDHIVPISFFRYEKIEDQEFQYCWSLNNLQPLWAKDNLSKNKRIIAAVTNRKENANGK
jgi:hypothetical protein